MQKEPTPLRSAREQVKQAKAAIIFRDPEGSLAEIIASNRRAFDGLQLL